MYASYDNTNNTKAVKTVFKIKPVKFSDIYILQQSMQYL